MCQSLEHNCPRKSGSMNAVDLSGLFKVSFYQEISVFAQQETGEREWKEDMRELQIMLTQKSQVKNYHDILNVFPPTSIFTSSSVFHPIKHMNTEGKMVCAKSTECSFTPNTDSCRCYSTATDILTTTIPAPKHMQLRSCQQIHFKHS